MFDAYGDESIGPEFVTYGLVLIAEDVSQELLTALNAVKAPYNNQNERLHSRILFSGNQRQKSAWASLSMSDVFALYESLFERIDHLNARKIVGVAVKKEFPNEILGGPWQSINPSLIGPMPWMNGHRFTDKHLASFCARATMIPLSKWPGLDRVRFWPDPDSTLIETSNGRRQFSGSLDGFIEVGPGKHGSIQVMNVEGRKPPLLEIADATAYVAQRTQKNSYSTPNERRFKSLNDLINAEIVRFQVGADGGFGINVPNQSLNYRPK